MTDFNEFTLPALEMSDLWANFKVYTMHNLSNHRKELGLSREQLADFFKLNVSTIRKWECGCTNSCIERHTTRLLHFLRGDYDQALNDKYIAPYQFNDVLRNVSSQLNAVLLRTIRVFALLEGEDKLQQLFIGNLSKCNTAMLRKYEQVREEK